MLRSLFSGKSSVPSESDNGGGYLDTATGTIGAVQSKPANLLVIQSDSYNWPAIFKGKTLSNGRSIRVWQVGWEDILVHADTYSTSRVCVEIRKLAASASGSDGGERDRCPRTIQPDFILVRNEVKTPNHDYRPVLNGFMFAAVPSANSLESILLSCERPAMQGFLHRLERRLGTDVFPVVPQHFASSSRALMYGYTFPAVVKVGSAHAGAGKMKITDHRQMSDFRSVLAMMPDEHCLVEPFIKGDFDLRIQKIGDRYRAFKRVDVSGEWKTNTGTAMMEEVECSERWRRWADESAAMFGGLDMFAVDAIVEEETGKEFILEVNGTSIGLHPDHAEEDNGHIRDLVLMRMNEALCSEGSAL